MERVATAAKISKADVQKLQLSRDELGEPIKDWHVLEPLGGE